jgi:hypothetical protein
MERLPESRNHHAIHCILHRSSEWLHQFRDTGELEYITKGLVIMTHKLKSIINSELVALYYQFVVCTGTGLINYIYHRIID